MYLVVSDFLSDNEDETADHPKIPDVRTALDDNIGKIAEADGKATEDTTGVTEDKSETRTLLEKAGFKVATALKGYALDIKDRTLFRKVNVTATELGKKRDTQLYVDAKRLHKIAVPLIASLADFRYQPADLTALSNRAENFFGAIPQTKDARQDKVVAGEAVDKLMADTDKNVLITLDVYMDSYKDDNNDLWKEYQLARQIDDTGSNSSGSEDFADTVPPDTTEQITTFTYDEELSLDFSNTGPVPLTFFVMEDGVLVAGSEFTLAPGGSQSGTLGDFAASGNELMVKNEDPTTAGEYEGMVG